MFVRAEEVGVSEPPFATLNNLTDVDWLHSQNQHYHMDAQTFYEGSYSAPA